MHKAEGRAAESIELEGRTAESIGLEPSAVIVATLASSR